MVNIADSVIKKKFKKFNKNMFIFLVFVVKIWGYDSVGIVGYKYRKK